MEGVWQLLIVGCACHFLSSPDVFAGMIQGTPEMCKRAQFVPGYNLAGEGLDIVTMKRKGAYVADMQKWRKQDSSCNLVCNDYMSHMKQKLPLAIETWRPLSNCKRRVQSKTYESSESLVRDSTSSVQNNWKIGLDIPTLGSISFGGTKSIEATFAMDKSKQDKYSFASHEVHCSFYGYNLASPVPLHKSFKRALNNLKKTYSRAAYQNLIDTYGTHYITKVKLGGKMRDVTAIRSCQATMKGLTDTAVKDCLDVEASATFQQTFSLQAEKHYCQRLKRKMRTHRKFSSMFTERHFEVVGGSNQGDILFSGAPWAYRKWLESLKTLPDIVHLSAKPLFYLMGRTHPARAGLKTEISNYIKTNALRRKCSGSCIGRRSSGRDPCACVCQSNGRITADCCPAKPGLATLKVYRLYAKGLYGDRLTKTDGSVKVIYGGRVGRTAVINNNDNPHWRETFNFGPITIAMGEELTFTVYDADSSWNSDLLGKCAFKLRQGTVSDSCAFQYGTFYFSYKVTCGPSLGGEQCRDYIPSPMGSSLAKYFISRNGILAGQPWHGSLARNRSRIVNHSSWFEDRSGE